MSEKQENGLKTSQKVFLVAFILITLSIILSVTYFVTSSNSSMKSTSAMMKDLSRWMESQQEHFEKNQDVADFQKIGFQPSENKFYAISEAERIPNRPDLAQVNVTLKRQTFACPAKTRFSIFALKNEISKKVEFYCMISNEQNSKLSQIQENFCMDIAPDFKQFCSFTIAGYLPKQKSANTEPEVNLAKQIYQKAIIRNTNEIVKVIETQKKNELFKTNSYIVPPLKNIIKKAVPGVTSEDNKTFISSNFEFTMKSATVWTAKNIEPIGDCPAGSIWTIKGTNGSKSGIRECSSSYAVTSPKNCPEVASIKSHCTTFQ